MGVMGDQDHVKMPPPTSQLGQEVRNAGLHNICRLRRAILSVGGVQAVPRPVRGGCDGTDCSCLLSLVLAPPHIPDSKLTFSPITSMLRMNASPAPRASRHLLLRCNGSTTGFRLQAKPRFAVSLSVWRLEGSAQQRPKGGGALKVGYPSVA